MWIKSCRSVRSRSQFLEMSRLHYDHLGYDSAQCGRCVLTFQANALPPSTSQNASSRLLPPTKKYSITSLNTVTLTVTNAQTSNPPLILILSICYWMFLECLPSIIIILHSQAAITFRPCLLHVPLHAVAVWGGILPETSNILFTSNPTAQLQMGYSIKSES